MDSRRRPGVTGEILGNAVLRVDAAIAGVQAADEPAVLLVRLEFAVCEPLPIAPHFRNGEDRGAVLVEDDGGDVVIEQDPLAIAVGTAGEEDLEGVVSTDAGAAAAAVAE